MRHAQAQCAVSLYSRGALEFACCAVCGQSGKTRHSWSLHRYSFCLCYIRQEEFFAQSGMIQKPATPNSVRSKSCSGGDKQTHLDVVEGFQRAGRTHLVAASPCLGNRQCALENTNLGPAPACPPHIGPPSPHALVRRLRLAMSAAGGPLLLGFSALLYERPVLCLGCRRQGSSRQSLCELRARKKQLDPTLRHAAFARIHEGEVAMAQRCQPSSSCPFCHARKTARFRHCHGPAAASTHKFSLLLLTRALTLSRSSSAMPAHPAPLRKRAPGLAGNVLRSFAFQQASQPWRDGGFLLLPIIRSSLHVRRLPVLV